MLKDLPGLSEEELERWIAGCVRDKKHILGRGYQGHVFLFEKSEHRLVIKTVMGRGIASLARRHMLRKEYQAYQKLSGLAGVPRCYGMLGGRHLVLEYVDGTPFRQALISGHGVFFDRLAEIIRSIHERGVAHGDMKKKDNLIVVGSDQPCLIDFGVAVIRKPGWAPLNHTLFNLAARFDINACAKFRLGRTPDPDRDEDCFGYRRTAVERFAGWAKRNYVGLKSRLLG